MGARLQMKGNRRTVGTKMRITIHVASFLALAMTQLASGSPPSSEIMDRVSHSVVQVLARECEGPDRSGTGFLWNKNDTAVTVLHLVGGCNRISAYFERSKVRRSATVIRTLSQADLALLHIDNAPPSPVLRLDTERPETNEELATLGYRLNVPRMSSTRLSVPYGPRRLEHILPENVRQEVRRAGSPSLSLEILLLEGHLLPGLSGAPIINANGHVVAVGDGGLENGAAEISWGLPVHHVESLALSNENTVTAIARIPSHFAAGLESTQGQTIQCGDLSMTKVRTRPFSKLVNSSDDPDSLVQITNFTGMAGFDSSAYSYDIYQHLDSGATVAIPSGLQLTAESGACVARLNQPGRAEIKIVGRNVSSNADIVSSINNFHQMAYMSSGLQWQLDPGFSYPMPHNRFDGLEIQRQSWIGYDGGMFALGVAQQAAIAFETLMTRNDVFIGVTTITYEGQHLTMDKTFECSLIPGTPFCQAMMQHASDFVSMLIGTFLATFPIG